MLHEFLESLSDMNMGRIIIPSSRYGRHECVSAFVSSVDVMFVSVKISA
jgi:hypothetical protein